MTLPEGEDAEKTARSVERREFHSIRMGLDAGVGIHLVTMKGEIQSFGEGNTMTSQQQERP
jgi:hypothetical protein